MLFLFFYFNFKEFLLLANGFSVKRFSVQGKPVQPSFTLSTSMGFTRIFLCHKISIFLGYIPHDDLIWLLTLDWKLIQIVRNEFRVDNLFYFYFTNEMIVIGPTKATVFLFLFISNQILSRKQEKNLS